MEVENYEELKDACKVLNRYPLVKGKEVLIITDGGGIGISIADACGEASLRVPELSRGAVEKLKKKLSTFASLRNPIDLTGSVRDEHYVAALQEAFSEEYDLAIVRPALGPASAN